MGTLSIRATGFRGAYKHENHRERKLLTSTYLLLLVAILGGTMALIFATRPRRERGAATPPYITVTLLWCVGLFPAILTLFSPRVVSYGIANAYERTGISRLEVEHELRIALTYFLALLASASAMHAILSRRHSDKREPWKGLGSGGGGSRTLWLASLAFFGTGLIAIPFSTEPTFIKGLILGPMVITALYVLPKPDSGWILRQLTNICRVYTYGSLVSLLLAKPWAVRSPYHGVLNFVDFRLEGLCLDSLGLGAIAAMSILLEATSQSHSRWKRSSVIVAGIVLLLTQAKTAWIALVVAGLIQWLFAKKSPADFSTRVGVIAVVVPLVLTVALFGTPSLSLDEPDWLPANNISTLTNRTHLWNITLEEWKRNPVFGYGPLLWGEAFRRNMGDRTLWAGNAHNQLIQTLGQSGALGAVGLLAYLSALLNCGWRRTRYTRGFSLSSVMALLILMTTSTPLTTYSVDIYLFIHGAVFVVISGSTRSLSPKDASKQNKPRPTTTPAA